jgi:filamentous hemagglutinin
VTPADTGSGTRQQNADIASQLESEGYTITGGGGKAPEEYIAGPGPGTRGGTFVDITATNGTSTVRVQTIDYLC